MGLVPTQLRQLAGVWLPTLVVAAPVATVAATPTSDDFNTCSLLSGPWSIVDPVGDCTVGIIGAGSGNAQLEFVVPGGVEHDAWVTSNNVPRAVQDIDNTNFTVEIKVDSSLDTPFQGVGIMVLESPDRFIRCEMHLGPAGPQLFVASVFNGVANVPIFQSGVATAPFWLRLQRVGNTWTVFWSTDGVDFTNAGSFNRAMNVDQVGPYALNAGDGASSPPPFTALVDYFFNVDSPIDGEDEGPVGNEENTLAVNVSGNGIVQTDPTGPIYECGEIVSLNAIPGANTGFAGWTGDINSQDNPLQISMTTDTTLTATFLSDTTPPEITCPDDFTAEAGNLPPPDFAGVIATDDFDPNPTISFSDSSIPGDECPTVLIIERTWTATDDAGNMSSCVQVITVEDHTPPVLVDLPANENAECDTIPPPPDVAATDAADDDPDVTLEEFIFDGDCVGRYTLQRTWTATDHCGNSSQATRFITVRDATPPTITLQPAPKVVQCDAVPPPQTPTVLDNCDPNPQLTFNESTSGGTCATGYTITRTWTATDDCGNTRYATLTMNVVDTDDPVLTLPDNVTIGCNDSTLPESTGFATATDSADRDPLVTFVDTPIPGGCPEGASIARQWTATDWAGNQSSATQTITVADTTPPQITGIPIGPVVAQCGNEPEPPTPDISDDCDPAPEVIYTERPVPTAGDCPAGFDIERRWTATDACGNTATDTQIVRFFDTTPPVLNVPPDITVSCAGSAPNPGGTGVSPVGNPSNTGVATATDDCDDDVTITYEDQYFQDAHGGDIVTAFTRTWTATDDCGNSTTGEQIIRLRDDAPPSVLHCPADRTLSTEDLTGLPKRAAPVPDFTDEVHAIDACSPAITVTQRPAPGAVIPVGQHIITFDVADSLGNEVAGACHFTLTLEIFADEDLCPDDPDKTEPGICGCGVPDIDSDGDGTLDCNDGCPNDPEKTAPGPCGCGATGDDVDSDKDGTPDCIDECPDDPDKTLPGHCGCGNPETDTDEDGTPDCIDGCPDDPDKTEPGDCGCGSPDSDSDGDGTLDCNDGCPNDPDKTEPGDCGCGVPDLDENKNGTPDCMEVCPTTGDCFIPHETPGCSSGECCDIICTIDPFCCNDAWDEVCAAQALSSCEVRPGNECHNAFPVNDGSFMETLADNSGATGDDTQGGDCDGIVDTIDEWYAYTAPVNGAATATTCSVNTDFNSTLAVFDACDGTEIACAAADAKCDFGSTVTWDIEFGITYLIRVSAVDDIIGDYEITIDSEPDDVPSEILDIEFWYGQNQSFGHIGQPQRQVNLLGNVHSVHGVASLTYELNGGPELPLSVGPDLRRLYHPGDFNVELFYEDLPPGPNQCLVRAQDDQGNLIERLINFTVTHRNAWPLPDSIDWSTAPSIQDVAQVVDGKWAITPDGVRVIEQGYDRLVAVGDISWTDYEVTVPITIHAIDPNGYLPPSHTPGIGLILRWEGHTDFLEPGSQPMVGYWPLGCAAEYVFHLDQCGYRLQLYGNPFVLQDQDDDCEQLTFGVTYMWKVRVDTQRNGEHFYGFKVWEQGTPEPPDWQLTMNEPAGQPTNGCLLLFSHHVDATYGNVEVTPVP